MEMYNRPDIPAELANLQQNNERLKSFNPPQGGGVQSPQSFANANMQAGAANAGRVQQLQGAIQDAARRLQWLSANGAHPNEIMEAQNQLQDLQGKLMQMQNSATSSWADRAQRLEGGQGAGSMGSGRPGGAPSPTVRRAQQVSQNDLARIMNMFGAGGAAGPSGGPNV